MPLTIVIHKSKPQSGLPQAALMTAAASSALGGLVQCCWPTG
jgi:hypothetical protein